MNSNNLWSKYACNGNSDEVQNREQRQTARTMNLDGKDNRKLIEALVCSSIFRDFARSFTEVTGLPVALVPLESCHLTFCGHRKENSFCALLSSCSRACATCLETQEKLTTRATWTAQTITCPSGLAETAVPVRVGEQLIGFLRTGQIFQSPPSPKRFPHLQRLANGWGLSVDKGVLRTAYFNTLVFSWKRYNALVRLLNIFAQHLGNLSNQLLLRQADANTESPVVARARAFIEEHFTEHLSLSKVAAASSTSPFHFCKIFKRATGLTFTAFVGRLRIEKSKNLLLNPNYRVSEIGYAVGFQSLTHFNRKFSQYVGESPSNYRLRVQRGLAVGRKTPLRAGTSHAGASTNGRTRSDLALPVQPANQALGCEWFPRPPSPNRELAKAPRDNCGHAPTWTKEAPT